MAAKKCHTSRKKAKRMTGKLKTATKHGKGARGGVHKHRKGTKRHTHKRR